MKPLHPIPHLTESWVLLDLSIRVRPHLLPLCLTFQAHFSYYRAKSVPALRRNTLPSSLHSSSDHSGLCSKVPSYLDLSLLSYPFLCLLPLSPFFRALIDYSLKHRPCLFSCFCPPPTQKCEFCERRDFALLYPQHLALSRLLSSL